MDVVNAQIGYRNRQRGFSLMEIMLSLVIFLMIVLLFGAAFPLVTAQAHAGNNKNQAAMLAQHKLDQLRAAGFTALQAPNGSSGGGNLINLGIIDPQSLSSNSVPYTATFTSVDNIAANNGPSSGYFPAGSTGTLTVKDLSSVNSKLGIPSGIIYEATVTIQWPGGMVAGGSYSASTLIVQNGEQ